MSEIGSNVGVFDSLGLSRNDQPKSVKENDLGQDAFLELMIAQMKNQDPLDPMESGEFMSQLAQFTTSSGVQELQKSSESMLASMQSYQALQASSLVGRSVLVPGGAGVLAQGKPIDGVVDLNNGTQQLVVGVYDSTGQLVRRIDMGMQSAGTIPFQWNGTTDSGMVAADGVYSIRAEAMYDNSIVAVGTSIYAAVDSVNLNMSGRGAQLNLAGLGTLDLSQIRQIK